MSLNQLFTNKNLAKCREKETKKKGKQRTREEAAEGSEMVSQENRGRKTREKGKKKKTGKDEGYKTGGKGYIFRYALHFRKNIF